MRGFYIIMWTRRERANSWRLDDGIGGRLLQGVKSLYVGSKACVRVGNEVSK